MVNLYKQYCKSPLFSSGKQFTLNIESTKSTVEFFACAQLLWSMDLWGVFGWERSFEGQKFSPLYFNRCVLYYRESSQIVLWFLLRKLWIWNADWHFQVVAETMISLKLDRSNRSMEFWRFFSAPKTAENQQNLLTKMGGINWRTFPDVCRSENPRLRLNGCKPTSLPLNGAGTHCDGVYYLTFKGVNAMRLACWRKAFGWLFQQRLVFTPKMGLVVKYWLSWVV